jgi:hypothetical protein
MWPVSVLMSGDAPLSLGTFGPAVVTVRSRRSSL